MDRETFKSRQQFLNEFFSKDRVDFLSSLKCLQMGDFALRNSIESDIFHIETEALFKKSHINRHIPFKNYHNFLTPFIYFLYSLTRQQNFLSGSDLYFDYLYISFSSNEKRVNRIVNHNDLPYDECSHFLNLLTFNKSVKGINEIMVNIKTKYRNITNEQYMRLGGYIHVLTEAEQAEEEYYDHQYYESLITNKINSSQCFKSEECVICLTNPPNVLFCNCGHICLCGDCKKKYYYGDCPICKTGNNIIRILE